MRDPNSAAAAPYRLAAGVALGLAVAVALGLFGLWRRANGLEARLAVAEKRERALEARAGDRADEAERTVRAAAVAESAAAAAERESMETARRAGAAAWEREIARQEAERDRAASEAAGAEAEAARERVEELRAIRRRELDRMREALAEIVETERTPLGLVMRLGEDALKFDFDKATIRAQDKEILSRIAGVLLASRGYRLTVYGHTDDQGPAAYNQGLSERRAKAVARYFVEAGIDPKLVEIRGLGESSPLVRGTGDEARRRNRRVEIGVVDTTVSYETLDDDAER